MKRKQIIFPEVNKVEMVENEIGEIGDNQVLVKTAVSTISCGTEKANITGDVNIFILREPDKVAYFPRSAGYSSSGVVVETGKNVKSVKAGDRVAMKESKHCDYNLLPEDFVVKINSDKVTFNEAALGYISTFSLAAIRKTRVEVGESAIVMGLGVLGQLAVAFLRAAGAVPVIGMDFQAERRNKAKMLGADFTFSPDDADFADKIKEITGGGVKAAIEVTGVGAGLNQCLDCMAKFGRVALLGCTRNKEFTVDYYRKVHGPGVTIIGAHNVARPEYESYPGYFTHRDDMKTMLDLCAANRIDLNMMIDEIRSPNECEGVYERLINDKNFPSVVQFDWSEM